MCVSLCVYGMHEKDKKQVGKKRKLRVSLVEQIYQLHMRLLAKWVSTNK